MMLYVQNHILRAVLIEAFSTSTNAQVPDVQAHLPLVLVGDLEGLLETPGDQAQAEIVFVKKVI